MRLTTSTNCGEVLDVPTNEDIEMVVIDMAMRGTDGFEFLKALNSSPKMQAVPVITLSALAGHGDLGRGRASSFDTYITKPMGFRAKIHSARKYGADNT